MTSNVLIAIADGSEEIETVTVADVLRRGGLEVTLASVMPERMVMASRGVWLVADRLIGDCQDTTWDALVLPGGMPGATNLANSVVLRSLLQRQARREQLIAAICASPAVVLGESGLLNGYRATCYPTFFDELSSREVIVEDVAVVRDNHFITSQGPATAMAFALTILEALAGKETRDRVAEGLLFS